MMGVALAAPTLEVNMAEIKLDQDIDVIFHGVTFPLKAGDTVQEEHYPNLAGLIAEQKKKGRIEKDDRNNARHSQ